ncbi:hypothetical protein [Winogradskyella sp. PE311]|uniref:hypothetical protein n=1 Tax=Winogradskyella sp. PE311 TaxID=3366943 RepID=UPI00397F83BB
MNILEISIKSFIKIILICLGVIVLLSSVYYLTAGGFFDGFLLTFMGLAFTYLVLILIVLLFRLITDLLMKRKQGLILMSITLVAAISIGLFLFKSIFEILLKFQN